MRLLSPKPIKFSSQSRLYNVDCSSMWKLYNVDWMFKFKNCAKHDLNFAAHEV